VSAGPPPCKAPRPGFHARGRRFWRGKAGKGKARRASGASNWPSESWRERGRRQRSQRGPQRRRQNAFGCDLRWRWVKRRQRTDVLWRKWLRNNLAADQGPWLRDRREAPCSAHEACRAGGAAPAGQKSAWLGGKRLHVRRYAHTAPPRHFFAASKDRAANPQAAPDWGEPAVATSAPYLGSCEKIGNGPRPPRGKGGGSQAHLRPRSARLRFATKEAAPSFLQGFGQDSRGFPVRRWRPRSRRLSAFKLGQDGHPRHNHSGTRRSACRATVGREKQTRPGTARFRRCPTGQSGQMRRPWSREPFGGCGTAPPFGRRR